MSRLLFNFRIALFLIFFTSTLSSAPNYYYPGTGYKDGNSPDLIDEIDKIESYLERPVPGLNVSFKEVINAFTQGGLRVYLVGGTVRDLLSGAESLPKDVDLVYSGKVEDLLAILEKKKWRYTNVIGKSPVIIGDHRNNAIGAIPIDKIESISESHLEFTINNIFYDCAAKTFHSISKDGLFDLRRDRLHILTDDWRMWLLRKEGINYYKFCRFWKMVGKGYIYTDEMLEFFRSQTEGLMRENKKLFTAELIKYLGNHFHSYDEILNGATAIMGYEWAQEHIGAYYPEIIVKYYHSNGKKDLYTHTFSE